MRAVVFTGSGGNEVVEIAERSDPDPGPHEVVVASRFAGLNPADLHQRQGQYPAPPGAPADVPGLEVAGDVVAVGERVSRWRVGDRVMGLVGGGGLADRVAVHESCVLAVPDALDDAEAAAVPETFVTAHDALRTQAGLTTGETVLIHGANGAVGTSATQLGVMLGARVLGSSRTEDGRALVRELGGEPVDDATFSSEVGALVDGVDVIIELVGAPHFPANLDVLATGGRIVVVGVGAGSRIELALRELMTRRARLIGTNLRRRSTDEKADAVAAFGRDAFGSLADGSIRPVIDAIVPLSSVHDAFDRLAGGGRRGKLLLDLAG